MKPISILVPIFLTFFTVTASAAVFETTTKVDENTLVLNGAGERTYLFVDVYSAGLYLSVAAKEPKEVLAQATPKVIKMTYHRGISATDMKKAWRYSLEKNCSPDCNKIGTAQEEFLSGIAEIKENDSLTYIFKKESVQISHNLKTQEIQGEEFSRVLLLTWIGEHPPTEKLKKALLAGKK